MKFQLISFNSISLYKSSEVKLFQAAKECVRAGGTLATFPIGNPQVKLAAFFKWLATQHGIDPESDPTDIWNTSSDCFFVGSFPWDYVWYWETYPPTQIPSSLFLPGHDNKGHHDTYTGLCVVPVSPS